MQLGWNLVVLTIVAVCLRLVDAQTCSPACQHGGLCSFQLTTGQTSCNCAGTGYSGTYCQTAAGVPSTSTTNVSTPASAPTTSTTSSGCTACSNGVCTKETDSTGYYCACYTGYSGSYCNQTTTPTPAPSTSTSTSSCGTCYNGTCTKQLDSTAYYCSCDTGYTGTYCNQTTSTSTSSAPSTSVTVGCSAGCSNGECIAYANGTSACQCNAGYTGTTCSTRSTASGSAEDSTTGGSHYSGGAIFALVLIVMLVALGISALTFVLWRRRRRQTFVRFQDGQDFGRNVEIGQQKSGLSLMSPPSLDSRAS